jgi:hypothetical protein
LAVCLIYRLDLTIFLSLSVISTSTAAMYVDVVTYLFNFLAERLKHAHDSSISARALRLRRLYLELIPPTISVVTLLIVTVLALRQAFKSLAANDDNVHAPDLGIMLAFSALNLLLDGLNVSCFARVDQTAGFIGDHHHSIQHSDHATVATETTPLVESSLLSLPSTDMGSNGDNGGVDDDADEHDSQDSSELPGGINLNMCSAFTVRLLPAARDMRYLLCSNSLSHFSLFSLHLDHTPYCSTLPRTLSEVLPSCWPLALRLSFLHSSPPATLTRTEQF